MRRQTAKVSETFAVSSNSSGRPTARPPAAIRGTRPRGPRSPRTAVPCRRSSGTTTAAPSCAPSSTPYYARLYGLTRDELRYILDPKDVYGPDFPSETFRVLKEKEERAYGEYRTRRLVLEAWDRMEQK